MTVISVIIMVIAAAAGFFLGAALNDSVGGMILLALISGIACIVHTTPSRGTTGSR